MGPECWSCGKVASAELFDAEAVLHARSPRRGGPYYSFRCPTCRELWVCYRGEKDSVVVVPPDASFLMDSVLSWFDPTTRRRLKRMKSWVGENARRAKEVANRIKKEGESARSSLRAEAGEADELRRCRETLGVSGEARWSEIKKAFRVRVKECHPDLYASAPEAQRNEVAREFQRIRQAFERLRDSLTSIGEDE